MRIGERPGGKKGGRKEEEEELALSRYALNVDHRTSTIDHRTSTTFNGFSLSSFSLLLPPPLTCVAAGPACAPAGGGEPSTSILSLSAAMSWFSEEGRKRTS
jgi:hypothetical protein